MHVGVDRGDAVPSGLVKLMFFDEDEEVLLVLFKELKCQVLRRISCYHG